MSAAPAAPTPSAPGSASVNLPPLPGAANSQSSATSAAPATTAEPSPEKPTLAVTAPAGATAETTPMSTSSNTPPTLNAAPIPAPESTEIKAMTPALTATKDALPPLGLPQSLPVPPLEGASGLSEPGADAIPALPGLGVAKKEEPAKPKVKTWATTLAPSIKLPETAFNYKRAILPPTIYRTEYSRENAHLPRRVTREDYEALLFVSVAKNDMNATRALLNAGTDINARSAEGETPLALAQRSGAMDVAALLSARGAAY